MQILDFKHIKRDNQNSHYMINIIMIKFFIYKPVVLLFVNTVLYIAYYDFEQKDFYLKKPDTFSSRVFSLFLPI